LPALKRWNLTMWVFRTTPLLSAWLWRIRKNLDNVLLHRRSHSLVGPGGRSSFSGCPGHASHSDHSWFPANPSLLDGYYLLLPGYLHHCSLGLPSERCTIDHRTELRWMIRLEILKTSQKTSLSLLVGPWQKKYPIFLISFYNFRWVQLLRWDTATSFSIRTSVGTPPYSSQTKISISGLFAVLDPNPK
jgi:hypothetical protein